MASREWWDDEDQRWSTIAVAAAVGVFVFAVLNVRWLADQLVSSNSSSAQIEARRFVIETGLRISLGIFGLLALWFTARRIRATERQVRVATEQAATAARQAETAARQADVAESGQQTDRFSRAVEQMGHESVAIRIGGIFALESLVNDEPTRFAIPCYEMLVTFFGESVRRHDRTGQPKEAPAPGDVTACLETLRRLRSTFDGHVPRLARHPTTANETGPHFVGLDLTGAFLPRLNFRDSTFENVRLEDATIVHCDFSGAVLRKVWFEPSRMIECDFSEARLDLCTTLSDATLSDCRFTGATFDVCFIENASLTGGNFMNAEFHECWFTGTNIVIPVSAEDSAETSFRNARFVDPRTPEESDYQVMPRYLSSDADWCSKLRITTRSRHG